MEKVKEIIQNPALQYKITQKQQCLNDFWEMEQLDKQAKLTKALFLNWVLTKKKQHIFHEYNAVIK